MIETWTWLEVGFTVVNLLGVIAGLMLLRRNLDKRSAAEGPGQELSGDRYIRWTLGRLACHVLKTAAGLYWLMTASPEWSFGLLTITVASVVLLESAVADIRYDRRMDRIIADERALGVSRRRKGDTGGAVR